MRSIALVAALALSAVCFSPVLKAEFASSAEGIRPVLVGAALPQAKLQTIDGKSTTLTEQLGGKPAVLVFYRGGWCPICMTQLSDLRKLIEPLKAKGVQLIAISPDQPSELFKTVSKSELDYTLLSDHRAQLIDALGIGFVLDMETRKKYAEYGIDLEKASGESHHVLPVPSVFVVDAAGKIQFHYINPDYRVRVPAQLVQAAVEALPAPAMKK
jgi:peroxiredoxin